LEAGGEGEGRAAEEGAEGTGEEVFSLDCRALRLPQSTSITKVTERERESENESTGGDGISSLSGLSTLMRRSESPTDMKCE
jgi:hypothetical protein